MIFKDVNNENSFVTKDINLITFLVYSGLEIEFISQDGIKDNYWFYFSDPSKCKELENLFWQHKVSVDPLVFESTKKSIKQMIISNRLNSSSEVQGGGVLLTNKTRHEKKKEN